MAERLARRRRSRGRTGIQRVLPCSWPLRTRWLFGLGKQLTPDQHAADLAGARADLVQLGVAPQAAGGVVVGVADAAERATQVALDAIQILGGAGYTNDYPLGRLLRDAKLYEIGAGTSEIRRMLIGREIFEKTE